MFRGARYGRNAVKVAFTIALLGLISGGQGVTGVAADSDPRLWYFNDFGVQDAFDAGYSGQGVTIAVIDSQINPSIPALQGTNLSIHEPSLCDIDSANSTRLPAATVDPGAFHGTNMAALILGNGTPPPNGQAGQLGVAPGATVKYYANNTVSDFMQQYVCVRNGNEASGENTAEAIDLAVADGAQIISMSFIENHHQNIVDAVARALRAGVVLIAGTPNDQSSISGLAKMNGIVTIQAMDPTGAIQQSSLKSSSEIDIVGPGVDILGVSENWSNSATLFGTSNSTAITAGFLAVVKSKYPTATGNQLIQTLIRNTYAEDHALQKDPEGYFGYGIVSLRHMLSIDPTQYPDVNPLIDKPGDSPRYDEIFGESLDTSIPTSSSPIAVDSPDSSLGALGVLPVVLIILVVLLIAGGVITTVFVVRSRKKISR